MSFNDIFAAAENGTVEDVRYFIEEKGVDVNAKKVSSGTQFDGETPLHVAAWYGNAEAAQYLISKGANANAKDTVRFTPLHKAAMDTGNGGNDNGKLKVAKLLVSNGADVNAVGPDNLTPLDMAKAGRYRSELREYLGSVGGKESKTSSSGDGYDDWIRVVKWVAIGIGVIILVGMCSGC